MNIGFTIIGKERDKAESRRDWRRMFRPSVAFALQQDIPLDRLVLAYKSGEEEFLAQMHKYISEGYQEQGKATPIEHCLLELEDSHVYAYERCFGAMYKALRGLKSGAEDHLYVHVVTGTHTMQFAMYIIAGKLLLPICLVQTRQRDNESDQEKPDLYPSLVQACEIDLSKYEESVNNLVLHTRYNVGKKLLQDMETRDADFKREIDRITMIGTETSDPILIYGDTGTGKTTIAQAIHGQWQERMSKQGNFVPFNCAGLPVSLAESELFGYKKGAFTGATRDKDGLLLAAQDGTLFLDEVGDLDLSVQAKLLKAISEKKFYPVGADYKQQPVTSDFRLICATNRDLDELVAQGKFREDLLARIRMWPFRLRNLRERVNDIDMLVEHALQKWFSSHQAYMPAKITFIQEARHRYLQFARSPEAVWTGNIRDLKQSINRMATLAHLEQTPHITNQIVEEEIATLRHLWHHNTGKQTITDQALAETIINRFSNKQLCCLDALEEFLQNYALEKCHDNQAKAGRLLYQSTEKPLSNPTSKFQQRRERLGKNE